MYLSKRIRPIFFLLFPFTLIIMFVIYPIVATVHYSFYDKNTGSLNFNNYIDVISSTNPLYMLVFRTFTPTPPWGALIHNLVWVSVHVPLTIFLGLILAFLLKYYVKGSTLVKTIIFLGMVVPPVVGGLIIRFMFDGVVGIFPAIFSFIGIEALSKTWTNYPQTALFALILGSLWIWLGFSVTVFSAALESIPKSHIDAARVFGASMQHVFLKVIVPQLRPAIIIVTVMTVLWDLKIFDIVYASTGGGPGGSTSVLALAMYNYFARALDYYKSATVAVILTLIVTPFIIMIMRWLKD